MVTHPLTTLSNMVMEDDEIAWLWLGQASFAYRFGNTATILIDPYLSGEVENSGLLTRICPEYGRPEDIVGDLILVTHDHLDHFDSETVHYAVERAGIPIAGPTSCYVHYLGLSLPTEKFTRIDRGESMQYKNILIKAVLAHHPSGDNIWDSVGFLIEFQGFTIYHVGDSELTANLSLETSGIKPDMLVVPINGKMGNMDAEEAASLVSTTEAALVIPMHFGMFEENTCNPQIFYKLVKETCPHSKACIPNPLEIVEVQRGTVQ